MERRIHWKSFSKTNGILTRYYFNFCWFWCSLVWSNPSKWWYWYKWVWLQMVNRISSKDCKYNSWRQDHLSIWRWIQRKAWPYVTIGLISGRTCQSSCHYTFWCYKSRAKIFGWLALFLTVTFEKIKWKKSRSLFRSFIIKWSIIKKETKDRGYDNSIVRYGISWVINGLRNWNWFRFSNNKQFKIVWGRFRIRCSCKHKYHKIPNENWLIFY